MLYSRPQSADECVNSFQLLFDVIIILERLLLDVSDFRNEFSTSAPLFQWLSHNQDKLANSIVLHSIAHKFFTNSTCSTNESNPKLLVFYHFV
jgi:hypothetical protein